MNNYTFYDLIEKFEYIEIPALQRDYAQGRREAEEIRSSFLSYLKGKLISEEKDTLDFIYGTVDEKLQKLVLIDGQQRLTTLFLLYWYLATTGNEQNREEFQLKMLDNGKSSRFRYATRSSSKEFCNALVSRLSEINTSLFSERPVSEVIIDQKWFQKQWINDSTVKSMLNMLDAMQNEFAPCDDNLYPRLQNVFSVDFLNLNLNFFVHALLDNVSNCLDSSTLNTNNNTGSCCMNNYSYSLGMSYNLHLCNIGIFGFRQILDYLSDF